MKIVKDVDPFRETKVRILNGIHTSMVMAGLLTGHETVRESMETEALAQFLADLAEKEIIPSMDLPADELRDFAASTFDRFRNPYIHHRLMSIALNSSVKTKTRQLSTVLPYYAKFGKVPERMVLAFTGFIRLYKGEWQGEELLLKDDEETLTRGLNRCGKTQIQWMKSPGPSSVIQTSGAMT